MSSLDDSTTPDASVSGSDETDNVVKFNPLSLIPDFADVRAPTDMKSVSAVIREEATEVLSTRQIMAAVKPLLLAGNIAGSANTAHSEIGRIVINASPVLTQMATNEQLTYVSAWRQILTVLKRSGYLFSGGYFIANTRDEAIADAADAAAE